MGLKRDPFYVIIQRFNRGIITWLFHQHHLTVLDKRTCLYRVDIDARTDKPAHVIGGVPDYGSIASILNIIDQGPNLTPHQIIDRYDHPCFLRKRILYLGRWVERIRIVLLQGKLCWQTKILVC